MKLCSYSCSKLCNTLQDQEQITRHSKVKSWFFTSLKEKEASISLLSEIKQKS